jgi:hypothetical protein
MLLKDDENTEFELKVRGYQFPQLTSEEYDSDWLVINIWVKHPLGSWASTDPCLLTWEAANLADWFEAIADGKVVDEEQSFLEPNLRFELIENAAKKLRVYFELECRPAWAPYDGAGMDDLWLEFGIGVEELRTAAASLRHDVNRFPIRVGFQKKSR